MPTVLFGWFLAAATTLGLVTTATLSAHELGTTRVSAIFHADRSYSIDVLTDAQSLVEKLEAVADTPTEALTPPTADAQQLQTRLRALQRELWGRMRLTFGEQLADPDLLVTVSASPDLVSPAVARLTLRGTHPAHASHFTWSYAWTFATYSLSVQHAADDEASVIWLEGGEVSRPLPLETPLERHEVRPTAVRYAWLGFTHILPLGADHMLFVLGLFLLGRGIRPLLVQVSAFTVAHSITLALATLGFVTVPPAVVEPLIAVSIAYVAVENMIRSDLKSSRVGVVFACGLLHGLGFAGVLGDIGLPRGEFFAALASFNVGVEAAQLAIVGIAYALLGASTLGSQSYRERVVIPASAVIAGVAVYWTAERLLSGA